MINDNHNVINTRVTYYTYDTCALAMKNDTIWCARVE